MKRPTTLNIMGQKISVQYKQHLPENYGLFYGVESRIEIDDNLSNSATSKVLIHEMTHAALSICGLSEVINNITIEEAICTMMESYASDIVRLSKIMK